jgi:hypothetical protein
MLSPLSARYWTTGGARAIKCLDSGGELILEFRHVSVRQFCATQPGRRQPPGPKGRFCSKCCSNPLRERSMHGIQKRFISPRSHPKRIGASHCVANEIAARRAGPVNTHAAAKHSRCIEIARDFNRWHTSEQGLPFPTLFMEDLTCLTSSHLFSVAPGF